MIPKEVKHEIRNATASIEANKLKILKLLQKIIDVLKDTDDQLRRIEEAIKNGKEGSMGKS